MKKNKWKNTAAIITCVLLAVCLGSCGMLFGTVTYSSDSSRSSTASAGPEAGIYVFYPRVRAYENGIPINAYIYQVEVRGTNMIVYIGDQAHGPSTSYFGSPGGFLQGQVVLTNLDRTSQTWERVGPFTSPSTGNENIGSFTQTFENVRGTRFSLKGAAIFEEFDLANAEFNLEPIAAAANGTYVFWPRIQAYENGMPANAFIHQVVVRGNNFNVYIGNTATGPSTSYWGVPFLQGRVVLTNLDRPSQNWGRVGDHTARSTGDTSLGALINPFEGITGTRFSLETGNIKFEEFDLSQAEFTP